MAVKSTTREPEFTTKDYLDARDAVIRSEITGMSDRLTHALGDLKNDMDDRFGTLDHELKLRPTTSNLHRSVAAGVGSILVVLIAVLAIVWAALDTGASMTASFSEDVLEAQGAHKTQAAEIKAINVKYEKIDAKLDTLIKASATSAALRGQTQALEIKQEPERPQR